MDVCELFTEDLNFKGTKGHTLKLEKPGYIRDSRKFFSHGFIGRWNSLDQGTMDALGISAFKGRLEKIKINDGGLFRGLIP